jgi:inosose dehydratase
MQAVFHPHVGTYVETRAEIDRLCELTDPTLLMLCPDTGHLAYAGADPEQLFSDYRTRIGYVHLKDIDAIALERVRREHLDFVEAVRIGMFVELGTGMVSIRRIIDALRDAHYRGWIIVEQDAPREPLSSAIANRAYLRQNFSL